MGLRRIAFDPPTGDMIVNETLSAKTHGAGCTLPTLEPRNLQAMRTLPHGFDDDTFPQTP